MLHTAAPIDRVAIEIGPLSIYWYGIIIAFGAILAIYLASKEADRLGLTKDLMLDFVMFAVPIAIIFARIYYVFFEFDQYANGPWWKVFAIWEGGIAIHGAVIGGVITAIVFAKVRKVSFWQIADIVAPSLILGQAIGRWGNFVNQEAHGGPISQATYESFHQYLPDFIMNQMTINGVMYHPTFLYESVWNILIFVGLLLLRKYNPVRGEVFLTYAITYSIGRYFIEGLRTDSLYMFDIIRTAQFISILIIIVSIIFIIYRRKTVSERYLDAPPSNKKKNKKSTKKKK
ncbi:prolipoprotein diacylglyceryl transferase [Oceanobacillus iheyensis]|uniref:Phosphatidylglycerol--prolipoprotein diacylglyceryl transferase n=1 Tax=Oceanobacillus iheyensis (strain DSM 14371 / CIP 107618 / JCM 11309 / KCTC 3954 / HTE831) TaxID=221109 RepID=LGT_OCEIH|nr:prolipoprotein diacylglyceryl transferase [Oceanobacillus iheyensis]Q8CX97.1 RecName: Full=Phosphatidylglycerol--prolipoprotein diacylglyceryl transferase [Oceanobacillus iheyensis HTE831]BAC14437.1 prolipoprotein diacylglyceryl transferase (spore germination protein) [Oceanobacillus iheyensis HTE831]